MLLTILRPHILVNNYPISPLASAAPTRRHLSQDPSPDPLPPALLRRPRVHPTPQPARRLPFLPLRHPSHQSPPQTLPQKVAQPTLHHQVAAQPRTPPPVSRTGPDHPHSPWTKFMVGAGGQAQGGTTNPDKHGAERQPRPSPGEGGRGRPPTLETHGAQRPTPSSRAARAPVQRVPHLVCRTSGRGHRSVRRQPVARTPITCG